MFEYYVSLGNSCKVASSMSKYGLRSYSGVFDWLVTSSFKWVLYYMETDFESFLMYKNLERYGNDVHHFRDKESGFIFMHDEERFESEYVKLKEKYDRRIKNLLVKTKNKTCYIRAIQSEEELEYICKNSSYINNVIHKNNPKNDIIFLGNSNLTFDSEFKFRYYKMSEVENPGIRFNLRSYFDNSEEFLAFCGKNFSSVKLMKNLAFDAEKEKYDQFLRERRFKTLITLLDYDFSNHLFSDKTIIYGAGIIGRELYKKIKHLTRVIYFVDNKKYGQEYEGIKIISESGMDRGGG